MLVWRRFVFPALMVVVIALDQFSKEWIRANLPVGSGLEEVCRIRIIHIQNSGAAFGLFTDQSILLTIVAVIGLIVILIFHRYWGGASLLGSFAMSLISAGAVGNLIDRIRLGHVTDFIYVRLWGDVFWPAFNVADSSISVGMILLVLFIILGMKKQDVAIK